MPRGAQLGLLLAIFFFYLLTGSRERPWADATPMFEVADQIVRAGKVSIRTAWPSDLPRGPDGRIYAVAPLVQSLMHVPAAALRLAVGRVFPGSLPLSLPFAAHFGPSLLGALACVLFLRLCRALGFARTPSLLATLGLALGSTVWVYARSPYAEVLQAVAFCWLLERTLIWRGLPVRRAALWFGAAAGLLVNTKMVYLVAVPGAALWALWPLRADLRRAIGQVGWSVLGFLPPLLLILGYNRARWGSFFSSGYDLEVPVFVERIGVGLWGLFLSPGKSVFLYSPVLLLAVWGLPRVWRRWPALLLLLAATLVPVLLIYSRFLFWSGDYAWGPRYLVFAVPALLLPAVPVIDDVLAGAHRIGRRAQVALLVTLLGAGIHVQALGASLFWDHFIRIAIEARSDWLGFPNKTGAPVKAPFDICGACFEDVHPVQWLPPFSPLEGHAWLLRHVLAGSDWKTATADAPWRRYTRLNLLIERSYQRARLDFWWCNFTDEKRPGAALAIALLFGLGLAGGTVAMVRSLRRAAPPPV